jgi:DNA-binding Xre family transcriptional regulator
MLDEERYKLLHGPYQSPAVAINDKLDCELRGKVVVVKAWSDGTIPWPCVRHGGQPGFILCGDLLRAVERESSLAIQHWWGVSGFTVNKWRKALNVKRVNEGTERLHRDYKPETLTDEVVALGLEKANSLHARLKAQQTRCERGTQPNLKPWTRKEEKLLGTMPDAEVSKRLKRAMSNVGIHRRKLGIPAYGQKHSACALRGRDTVVVAPEELQARRLTLGLTQKEVARRGTLHFLMYSALERGTRRRVLRQTLFKVAKALECSPSALVTSERSAAPGSWVAHVLQENGGSDA